MYVGLKWYSVENLAIGFYTILNPSMALKTKSNLHGIIPDLKTGVEQYDDISLHEFWGEKP